MLVLSRKTSEKIVIGNSIEVMVVEIQAGKVRLGVHAPRELPIDRAEVRESKLAVVVNQHEAPLEEDGGPASPVKLHVTDRPGDEQVPLECDFA